MKIEELPKEKLYYSIGEVAELFELPASTIRFWSNEFKQLNPKRNKKGNRLFTPKDLQTLQVINHLIKDRGYSMRGVKQKLPLELSGKSEEEKKFLALEKLSELKLFLTDLRSRID